MNKGLYPIKKIIKHFFSELKPNPWEENKEYLEIDPSVIIAPGSSVDVKYRPEHIHKCVTIQENSQIFGNLVLLRPEASITIGKMTQINAAHFIAACGITVGDDVLIAHGVNIWDNDSHSLSWQYRKNDVVQSGMDFKENPQKWTKNKDWSHVKMGPITIGDKVWIGFNSAILKDITIGEGAVVGAMSVVTKNVKPYTLVAGNPARYIRDISEDERNETNCRL